MDYPYFTIKTHIIKKIKNALHHHRFPEEVKLETPPSEVADFAFPCFSLCRFSKKSPKGTAELIAQTIKPDNIIVSVTTLNGYINFTLNASTLIKETIQLIHEKKETYGHLPKKGKTALIEHTSANPNGPLHVGRARNPIIGDTLTRLFNAAGYEATSQFYLDDLGKQVAMLAWGMQNIVPDEQSRDRIKTDHQAVIFYQKTHDLMEDNEKIRSEVGDIVKKSEQGDEDTIEKVKQAYIPVLEGIQESLSQINIHIDSYIPESTFVKDNSVENIINQLQQTPYCSTEDGASYLDLESFGVKGRNTKFFITRGDGTSLYATRDIAYHVWKAHQADRLINILGEDHKLEAKQVEICLNLLNEERIPHPVFYAFVSLPGGKMSTRRNRVVYLDDLIEESVSRAYEEVQKRRKDELSEAQMEKIASIIGVGAIRYNIIKVQPEKDIVFKWEEALNFEGNAAPFIQYAHARAAGILSKSTITITSRSINETPNLSHESEIILTKKLALFPQIIYDAVEGFKPHIIASYLSELASLFNQFYRDCPVLSIKEKHIQMDRLFLVSAVKQVIHNGLNLLGIEAPDEM